MHVYLINDEGLQEHAPELLDERLAHPDGVVRVDMPVCRRPEAEILSGTFGFRDIAVRDCLSRNHVSKIYAYEDHVFTVLHAPKIGRGGHVHYIELDQFLGHNYLVTVHGPLNPVVEGAVALQDTGTVLTESSRASCGHAVRSSSRPRSSRRSPGARSISSPTWPSGPASSSSASCPVNPWRTARSS